MISSRAPGRCTLTTTREPSASVARCTSAMVPAASGFGSIDSKTSSHGTPSSSSMTWTTCCSVSGGTLSCSVASSSMNSGGTRSGRVERICPSLQNVGPSSSSAARRRRARARIGSSPGPGLPNSSFSPCLAMTAPIWAARPIRGGSSSSS